MRSPVFLGNGAGYMVFVFFSALDVEQLYIIWPFHFELSLQGWIEPPDTILGLVIPWCLGFSITLMWGWLMRQILARRSAPNSTLVNIVFVLAALAWWLPLYLWRAQWFALVSFAVSFFRSLRSTPLRWCLEDMATGPVCIIRLLTVRQRVNRDRAGTVCIRLTRFLLAHFHSAGKP